MPIDQAYLDRYIIIPTNGALPELDSLRELEADFGAGIHVLWDDAAQSIVAFAFEPALFTPASARAWLAEARAAQRVAAIAAEARRDAAQPVLYVLTSRLLACDARGADDTLIWKEILRPGSWFKTDTGRRVDVTAATIMETYRAFKDGLPQYVSVPADHHHFATGGIVPPEANRGFVRDLHLTADYRLFGGFDLRDPVIAEGVRDGTIADCSVFIQSQVVHNVTGQPYPWVLRHVLLTNNPLLNGLSTWGEKPVSAAADDVVLTVEVYQPNPIQTGGIPMPDDMQLTEQELAQFKAFQTLGLSADQIAAMQQRDQAVRQKARALEIGAILNALQGKGEHAGVAQVAGYVHYPVVAQAVAQALQSVPAALALDADENGATGLDATLLAVVNAIPREGRLPLAAQPHGRKDAQPLHAAAATGDKPTQLTDEQLDTLADLL